MLGHGDAMTPDPPTFTIRLPDGSVWCEWTPTPEMWRTMQALKLSDAELEAFVMEAFRRID
jgi:hypothetical protein